MYLKVLVVLLTTSSVLLADSTDDPGPITNTQTGTRNRVIRRRRIPVDNVEYDDENQVVQKLRALLALGEQQARKMENLEYKISKMEIHSEEKLESARTEIREIVRIVQQLNWQWPKIEDSLEQLQSDTAYLKLAYEQQSKIPFARQQDDSESANSVPRDCRDVSKKLNILATSMNSIRGGIRTMHEDLLTINQNLSQITNKTRELSNLGKHLVTKQYLNTGLLELRQGSNIGHVEAAYRNSPHVLSDHTSSVSDHQPSGPVGHFTSLDNCFSLAGTNATSDVYFVNSGHGYLFCDLDQKDRGAGWTVIQNRFAGSVDFYRGYHDYKYGFGNIAGEFWLGLEKIHQLTHQHRHELLIELEDWDGVKRFAQYSIFVVGPEIQGYPLSALGQYIESGGDANAGDSLSYHAGQKFSTYDTDNDNWPEGSCAQAHKGGWWYNACDTSNLNGQYLTGELPSEDMFKGMYWRDFRGESYSLKSSRMMLRPVTAQSLSNLRKSNDAPPVIGVFPPPMSAPVQTSEEENIFAEQ